MRHSKGKTIVNEVRSCITKPFSRFAVALGGFIIFIGILLTCSFVMDLLGFVDFSLVESGTFHNVSILLFFVIGLIDLLAGIILWKR
jgi:hypothetical protein